MRSLFNLIFVGIVAVSIVFFTREYETYRPQAMTLTGSQLEPFSEEGIHIAAKAYSRKESLIYLNQDLLHLGLQPLQLTIQNNSSRSYYLSRDGLALPHLSSRQVAGKLHQGAIPRSIVFRVAGFFFWPFLIPGAVDSILTMRSYFLVKRDYESKTLKRDPEIIVPYSTVNRIIFLPADQVSSSFDLYLQDPRNGIYHPFSVDTQS